MDITPLCNHISFEGTKSTLHLDWVINYLLNSDPGLIKYYITILSPKGFAKYILHSSFCTKSDINKFKFRAAPCPPHPLTQVIIIFNIM